MSNSNLVYLTKEDHTPVTTSEVIATALNKEHKDVIALAKKYQADLNEFGVASFKTNLQTRGNRNGTQEKEIAILNEQQATLLISYMRNSDKVRKFKIALVKAFFEMRKKIEEGKTSKLENKKFSVDEISEEAKEYITSAFKELSKMPVVDPSGKTKERIALDVRISSLLFHYTYITKEFIEDLIKEKISKTIEELTNEECVLMVGYLMTLAYEGYLCKINLYFKKKLFKGL